VKELGSACTSSSCHHPLSFFRDAHTGCVVYDVDSPAFPASENTVKNKYGWWKSSEIQGKGKTEKPTLTANPSRKTIFSDPTYIVICMILCRSFFLCGKRV
jgi:hypothetical protein